MAQKFNFENQPNHSAPELPTKKSKADRAVEAERDQMLAAAKKTEQAPKQLELFDLGEFRSEEAKKPEKGFFGNMKDRMVGGAKKTWENLKSLKKPSENNTAMENNEPTENVEETETPVQLELDLGMSEAREEIIGRMTPVERKNLFKQMKGWSKDQIEKYKSLPTKDKIIVAGIAVGAIGLVGAGGFAAVTAAGFSGSGIGSFTALGMGKSVLGFGAIEGVKGVAVGTAATMAKVYAGGMAAGAITGSGLSAYSGFKVLDKLSKKAKGNNINPEDQETVATTASLENNSQTQNQASQNETTPDISTVEPESVNQRKGFGRVIDRAKNSFQPTQPTRQNMPLQSVDGMVRVERFPQDVAESQNLSQENLKAEKTVTDIANEVAEITFRTDASIPLEKFVDNMCKLKAKKELDELGIQNEDEKRDKFREIALKYQGARDKILAEPGFQQRAREHDAKLKQQEEVKSQVNVEPIVQSQENNEYSKDVIRIVNEITEEMYITNPDMSLEIFVEYKCDNLKQSEQSKISVQGRKERSLKYIEISNKYLEIKNKIFRDPEFQGRAKEHNEKLQAQKKAESQVNIEQETTKPKLEVSTEMRNLLDGLKASVQVTESAPQHFNTQEQRTRRHLNLREKLSHLSGKPRPERKKHHQTALENLKSSPKVENLTERFPIPPTPEELALKWQREAEELKSDYSETNIVTKVQNDPYKAPEFFDNAPNQQVEAAQIAKNNDSPELTSLKSELAGLEAEFSATDEAWSNVGSLDRQEQVVLGRNRRNIGDKMMEVKGIIEKTKELQRKQKLTESSTNTSSENLNALEMVKELERMEEELEDLSTGTPEEAELSIKIKELKLKIYETGVEGLMSNKETARVRDRVFGELKRNILDGNYDNLKKFINNPLESRGQSNSKYAIEYFTNEILENRESIIKFSGHIKTLRKSIGSSDNEDLSTKEQAGTIVDSIIDEILRYEQNNKNSENKINKYTKALELINSL